ncbi:MAG: hypothetical protein PUK81_09055, partial [Firmicutes bacterium]|nr:hypothetical protein [Bacillota bacterium]
MAENRTKNSRKVLNFQKAYTKTNFYSSFSDLEKAPFHVRRGGPMCPPAGKDVVPQKSNANSHKIRRKYEFAQDFHK